MYNKLLFLLFFGFCRDIHADTSKIALAYVSADNQTHCAGHALRVRVKYPADIPPTETIAPESIITCGSQETIQWDTSYYGTSTLEFDDKMPIIEVKRTNASVTMPWITLDLNSLKSYSNSLLPVIIDCQPELPYSKPGFKLLGIPEAEYFQQYKLVRQGANIDSNLVELSECIFA